MLVCKVQKISVLMTVQWSWVGFWTPQAVLDWHSATPDWVARTFKYAIKWRYSSAMKRWCPNWCLCSCELVFAEPRPSVLQVARVRLCLYRVTPNKAQSNEPLHCQLLLSPFLCTQGAVGSGWCRQSREQRMGTFFNCLDQCKKGFVPHSDKDSQVAEA